MTLFEKTVIFDNIIALVHSLKSSGYTSLYLILLQYKNYRMGKL